MAIGVRANRKQIDHKAVVELLKKWPGTWQFLGHYGSLQTVKSMARQIKCNRYSPAYETGAFDTYYAPDTDDGMWELWVVYEGESGD